ncbi:hypothetical protein BH23CHL9_BH23CHL9_07530 [soil metagenome]
MTTKEPEPRREVSGAGLRQVTRVSAYAVCSDDANRILLCRIAPGGNVNFAGWWTVPGGGLDHGEDPRDAALRDDGSTDTARWFTPDELSAERLVDIAELAARRIGLVA